MNTQRKLVIVACLLLVALPIVVATPLAAADPIQEAGKCVDLRPDNPLDPVAVYDCPTTAQP